MNLLEPPEATEWTPAPRERPSLFDGDDHAVELVDRAAWQAWPGRISPVEATHNRKGMK